MYSATFLIAVHPSSVTSSISHRSTVTSTWREVRTRASRRPSSSSVNRPQATTYGRDSGFPILWMTAMTGESWHLEASYNSRTIWGAAPPKVYSPESLQNAVYRQSRSRSSARTTSRCASDGDERRNRILGQEVQDDRVHQHRLLLGEVVRGPG